MADTTWPDRIEEFKQDPHIQDVARRVHKINEFVQGARDAVTYEQVLHEIANAICMWKHLDSGERPGVGWLDTPRHLRRLHGYFEVTAGPHDGWSISIRVGSIYDTHLHTFFEEARARQEARDSDPGTQAPVPEGEEGREDRAGAPGDAAEGVAEGGEEAGVGGP